MGQRHGSTELAFILIIIESRLFSRETSEVPAASVFPKNLTTDFKPMTIRLEKIC
jgi:hypothetical protein